MDLSVGFTVDDPPVTLKWGAAEAEIQKLIGTKLRQVTAGYSTMPVVALGGLRCSLGLHFDRKGKGLQELEFFGNECPDLKASFDEFQRYFEAAFGAPTRTRRGTEGFPDHTWLIGRREIFHVVRETVRTGGAHADPSPGLRSAYPALARGASVVTMIDAGFFARQVMLKPESVPGLNEAIASAERFAAEQPEPGDYYVVEMLEGPRHHPS